MEGSSETRRDEQAPLAKYKLGRLVGTGGFAKVLSAEHLLTGQKVAVKILNRAEMRETGMTEKVEREIEIMRLLRHPHVIRFYDVIDTDEHIYIIMEFAELGQLHDHVSHGKLHEGEARRIFQQIISGVAYCHRNMVVHRDLKMENILLDSDNIIKIADFGLSNFFRYDQLLRTSCGSLQYAAPELIEGRPYTGPEVDVWSCGVILYSILRGRYPFDDPNESALRRRIRSGKFKIPTGFSDHAKDLISSMLFVNPAKRITITEVQEHPWLQVSLPHYLSIPPLDARQQIQKIDEETVQEVVKMGFDKNSLVESLQKGVENEGTVVYNFIFDKRLDAPSRYLWTAYQDTMLPQASSLNHADACSGPSTAVERFVPERKWTLGLEFHDCPRTIMHKVMKALQELDVFYGNSGYYKMKCAWFPGVPGDCVESVVQNFLSSGDSKDGGDASNNLQIDNTSPKLSDAVLFEIQLYKAGEWNYLLDLTRISGPQLRYLDVCSQLLSRLRIV